MRYLLLAIALLGVDTQTMVPVQTVDKQTIQQAEKTCGFRAVEFIQEVPPALYQQKHAPLWTFACLTIKDKSYALRIQISDDTVCPSGEKATGEIVTKEGRSILCGVTPPEKK